MNRMVQWFRFLLIPFAGFLLLQVPAAALGKQPTILMVMADDMGWTDI